MASIDDVRGDNEILIDLTAPQKPQPEQPKKTVSMNGDTGASMASRGGRHTFVEQKQQEPPRQTRIVADISDLASGPSSEDQYDAEHVKNDMVSEMLEGPDSMLAKYMDRKTEEMTQMYEDAIERAEMDATEAEIDNAGDVSADGNLIQLEDYTPVRHNKKVKVDDGDILSSLNKEDNQMSEFEEDIELGEDEDLDSVIADDDSVIDDDFDEEEDIDLEVEENIVKEEPKKETPKKKIEKPDIEVEVSKTGKVVIEPDMDAEDEEIKEDNSSEMLKKLQKVATEKLKPAAKALDLSSFTVLKKPTASTKQLQDVPTKVAKWVLFEEGGVVIMREFTGSELEKLREYGEDSRSLTNITRRFRMIYDHIESAKPANFETWLKCTPYIDVEHLYFAIYIASFKGANYLPLDCTNRQCGETWLTEDIDIMDMVKFENEEAKKKFTKIYQSEEAPMSSSELYVSEIVPLSANIACAFKEPSIYNSFEIVTLDQEFRAKYSDILSIIPYIDGLYFIDQESHTLTPVGYKVYENNNTKSTKSKVIQYNKVLNTLSVDEFYIIRSYVAAIDQKGSGVSYRIPECECPKCGTTYPERDQSAENLLFTRYQLGALVNTSLS